MSVFRVEISLFYIHLVAVKFLNMVEYSTPVEGIYLRYLPQSEVSIAVWGIYSGLRFSIQELISVSHLLLN